MVTVLPAGALLAVPLKVGGVAVFTLAGGVSAVSGAAVTTSGPVAGVASPATADSMV